MGARLERLSVYILTPESQMVRSLHRLERIVLGGEGEVGGCRGERVRVDIGAELSLCHENPLLLLLFGIFKGH